MLDQTKIPSFSNSVVQDYFLKMSPNSSFDNAFMLVQTYISKLLCSNRVRIVCPIDEIDTYPNIYCLNMGRSGTGKDRMRKQMERLIPFYYEDISTKESDYRKACSYDLEKEGEKEGLKNVKLKSYVKEKMPRSLYSTIKSNSTPEGLASLHNAIYEARFGCITWQDSEISDTMARYKSGSPLDDLCVMFKEAYDDKIEPKIIKGEKTVCANGVLPYIAWLHGAVDVENGQQLFNKFFSLGFARRLIFCMEEDKKYNEEGVDLIKSHLVEADEEKEFITSVLEDIYKRTENDLKFTFGGTKEYTLSDDCLNIYLTYKRECQKKAGEMFIRTSDKIKSEQAGRAWKALKLACVFEAQNSKGFVITEKSMESAIYVCDYFAGHFRQFLRMRSTDTLYENMIDSLRQLGQMKKTDFYSQSYFPKFKSGQSKLFDESIKAVREVLSETKEDIMEYAPDKRTVYYKIIKLEEISEEKETEILAYISDNGQTKQLTLDHLVKKFGYIVGEVLTNHKVQIRKDGGYFI